MLSMRFLLLGKNLTRQYIYFTLIVALKGIFVKRFFLYKFLINEVRVCYIYQTLQDDTYFLPVGKKSVLPSSFRPGKTFANPSSEIIFLLYFFSFPIFVIP